MRGCLVLRSWNTRKGREGEKDRNIEYVMFMCMMRETLLVICWRGAYMSTQRNNHGTIPALHIINSIYSEYWWIP